MAGFFNLTNAAEENNAENLLVIRDRKLAEQYTKKWEKHARHSEVYVGRAWQDQCFLPEIRVKIVQIEATLKAVAGGKTQMGVANLDGLDVLHEQKKIRILAQGGPQKDEFFSKVPTLVELGYPQIALDELVGVFGPPGLPKERQDILEKAFEKASADPEFRAAAAKASIGLFPLSSAEFFKASKSLHDMIYEMQDLLKMEVK